MRFTFRTSLVATALLPAFALGQTKTDAPMPTSLCELVKEPQRLNGRLVKFRAEYVSKFQWTGVKDENCSASIPIGAYHALDDLKPSDGEYAFTTIADDMTHPERLKWKPIKQLRPVRLLEDRNYREAKIRERKISMAGRRRLH